MKYKRIKDLREDNDYTQVDVAKFLNISQRAYSHYENDDRSIPVEILIMLADFYNTSLDYLVNRTDIKKPYDYKKARKNK